MLLLNTNKFLLRLCELSLKKLVLESPCNRYESNFVAILKLISPLHFRIIEHHLNLALDFSTDQPFSLARSNQLDEKITLSRDHYRYS